MSSWTLVGALHPFSSFGGNMPTYREADRTFYVGAEDACDGCAFQREKEGRLTCGRYEVSILYYFPACMRTNKEEHS
jgi:hypothetical protein